MGIVRGCSPKMRTAKSVKFGAQTRNSVVSSLRTDAPNCNFQPPSVGLFGIGWAPDVAFNAEQHRDEQAVALGARDVLA